MGGLLARRKDANEGSFRTVLSRYERRRSWFKDEEFIKDLESDSVDTEVLDEELQALEASESKSWRFNLHKFLESNPVQIAMCILVLIDAGVVIAEILLDINAIRMQSDDASDKLGVAVDFLRRSYSSELNGYSGDDIFYIVDTLELRSNATSSPRHRRDVTIFPTSFASLAKQYSNDSAHNTSLTYVRVSRQVAAGSRRSLLPNRTAHRTSVKRAVRDDSTVETPGGHDLGQNASESQGHHSDKSHLAHELLELAHILHYISISILGAFVIQVMLKITALGPEFFHQKMEIFDAFIVIASFVLDLVFVKGVTDVQGDETIALIMIFLLWRILRIINGMMLTSKKRQEFRIKLQKRARRKLEKRIECLLEDKEWREREFINMRSLCLNKGATEEELRICKPRRRSVFHKLTTSTGLSSIASLSLGLSLSGPLVLKNQLPAFPILPRSCRTSLAGTIGTKSTRSSSTSLEPVWMGRSGEPSCFDSVGDSENKVTAYHRAPCLSSRSNTCEEETGEEEEGDVGAGPSDSTDDDRTDQCVISMTDRGSMTTTDTGVTSEDKEAAGQDPR